MAVPTRQSPLVGELPSTDHQVIKRGWEKWRQIRYEKTMKTARRTHFQACSKDDGIVFFIHGEWQETKVDNGLRQI